jgi:glutamine amidotransferase
MNKKLKIGIIHYGCGNIYNVAKSLYKTGLKDVTIVKNGSLKDFDVLILPGVGSFKNAMQHIKKNNYIEEIIDHIKSGKKILGICLGMQLLMQSSEELQETKGLSILKGNVLNLKNYIKNKPLPHVGLNSILLNNVKFSQLYFDHSYAVILKNINENFTIGHTSYDGYKFVSYLKKDNITAVQFHPELSGEKGLKFLYDFFIN